MKNKLSKNQKEPEKTELDSIKSVLSQGDLAAFVLFCDQLAEITQHKTIPPLLYRGQANKDWDLASSLYRALHQSQPTNPPTPLVIKEEVDVLLEQARKRQNSHPNITRIADNDLELLAEIQHMGGKTPLIDFSYNALTSLFFACQPTLTSAEKDEGNDKNQEADGKLFMIYPYANSNLTNLPIQNNYIWKKVFNTSHSDLFIWEPPQINYRVIKQDSIFVFNQHGFLDQHYLQHIIIDAAHKKPILKVLRLLLNMDMNSVYPDFLGYVQEGNHYG